MLHAQQALLEASDFRGQTRRVLRLAVDASFGGSASSSATIHNISETGLLLETDADIPVGEWLGVDLPGSGLRSAQVVWASEHLFGCRFDAPVTPATVSAALLRAPFGNADPIAESPPVNADRTLSRHAGMATRDQVLTIAGLTIAVWAVVIGLLIFL